MDGQMESTANWTNCAKGETFVIFSYVLFSAIFIPTILGNVLILVCIIKFRHLRSNMHILIGNLALADLLIGVSIILQVVGNFVEELALNKYYCLGQNAVFVISLGTSSLNLLSISIERFIAVKFPLKYRFKFTQKTTYILICVSWGYIVIAAIPLAGWNEFNGDTPICDTDLVWTKGYDILLFGGLLVIIILNAILVGFVMKIISENAEAMRYNSSNSLKNHSLIGNLRRTKLMLIVFGVFAICWTPYLVISVVMVFYNVPSVRCARQWCICLGLINSALNWVIYGLANRTFREAFRAVLKGQTVFQLRASVRKSHNGTNVSSLYS